MNSPNGSRVGGDAAGVAHGASHTLALCPPRPRGLAEDMVLLRNTSTAANTASSSLVASLAALAALSPADKRSQDVLAAAQALDIEVTALHASTLRCVNCMSQLPAAFS